MFDWKTEQKFWPPVDVPPLSNKWLCQIENEAQFIVKVVGVVVWSEYEYAIEVQT